MSAIVTLARRRVGVKSLYNPGEDKKLTVGDQTSWREDAGLGNMSQRGWTPRPPRLSSPGERERNAGGQYVAVLFGLKFPLTHNPFK